MLYIEGSIISNRGLYYVRPVYRKRKGELCISQKLYTRLYSYYLIVHMFILPYCLIIHTFISQKLYSCYLIIHTVIFMLSYHTHVYIHVILSYTRLYSCYLIIHMFILPYCLIIHMFILPYCLIIHTFILFFFFLRYNADIVL